MIELGKKYQTRDGRAVRIYATDGIGLHCVQGSVQQSGGWLLQTWDLQGRTFQSIANKDDLIEVKPEITGWVNIYKDNGTDTYRFTFSCVHSTQEKANQIASLNRIACIQVTFKEGDGL